MRSVHLCPTGLPIPAVLKVTGSSSKVVAYNVVVTPASPPAAGAGGNAGSLALLLSAAFGGGLLLNLMPCVFPILAMKAMGFARLSGASRGRIRREALSYTAGVVTAFLALGTILLALRGAGEVVGWGFQLQSSAFVTIVAWVLFLTALNMSDVFDVGGRFVGAGQGLANRAGHVGSFFTGLLAVVVATPCTASFMGAAIAEALVAPASAAMAVFAVMGLGLATPYALVAAFPAMARILPAPGRWMATLRQCLAFPIYAAVAWLLWVISQQTGPDGILCAGFGLVAVGFAAWVFGRSQASTGRVRVIGAGASLVVIALSVVWLFTGVAPIQASEPYTPARLAELRSEGRPVFVNMTAAWCISCLVNERLALSSQQVKAAFGRAHVVYLRGDWTRQDPAISAFLHDHGREGVPLYLLYPPGQPPVSLPQVLGPSTLTEAVAKLAS